MLSPIAIHNTHRQKANIPVRDESGSRYAFLGDLGKPTLRGVRKCDKCGTLNGTRGIRCKNQHCDQVFKIGEKRKPCGPEAVKLVTDPGIQVYSVRGKTGDYRGFVQLPIVQDLEGNPAVVDIGIVCSAAKCYVETCARSRNEALEPCFHITSSVEALDEATPLTFKNSILNSMPISTEMRQQIWTLATDKPGPLVQRVAGNIMAVKTPVSVKYPLGYLHFTFLPNRKEEKRFVCSCREAKITRVTMSESDTGGECTYRIQRCLHFYSCICAFASDEALSKEFRYAIDADTEAEKAVATSAGPAVSPVADSADLEEGEEPSGTEAPTNTSVIEVDEDGQEHPVEVIVQSTSSATSQPSIEYSYVKSKRSITVSSTQPETKRFKSNAVLIQPQSSNPNTQVFQSFLHWLQTVTERINLTMHYSLPGNPKPLVFHIPHAFWECLMQRISNCSSNKKLLPDQTCTLIRTHNPPIGTFTQFSWYLTQLSHVRKVFDTGEVALLVSKYYDKAANGTYSLSATPRVQVDSSKATVDRSSTIPRLHNTPEYKTFLRVGGDNYQELEVCLWTKLPSGQQAPADSLVHGLGLVFHTIGLQGNQGVVPFIIDWIPDMFPITQTGELSLQFQYSHMIDGLSPAVEDHMVHHVIEGTSPTEHHHSIIVDM